MRGTPLFFIGVVLCLVAGCTGKARSVPVCDETAPTAPVLACPDDATLSCAPEFGVPFSFVARAVTCEGPAPTVACSRESGEFFMPGEETVTCTAVSATGEEASCSFTVTATPTGVAQVLCPAAITQSCEGRETSVTLSDPTVDTTCGPMVGALIHDAPASGFPVGETTVRFSGADENGTPVACTTTVTITDITAPMVSCEPSVTVVRTAPEDMPTVPAVVATDNCDEAPVVATVPPLDMLVRGDNPVTVTVTDAGGLSAECTTNVEVLEAFTPEEFRIISAEIASDGSTDVTIAWDAGGGGDLSGYAIDRAPSPTGPWTELRSVGVGARTFTDETLVADVAFYRVRSLAGAVDGGTTLALRALSIQRAGYDLGGQRVPTISFATTLYGVVRHPKDLTAGPYPLVLLLHGNHGICRLTPTSTDDICAESRDHECPLPGFVTTPNAEGLVYLAESIAAQGYVAVTISGNAVNCRRTWIGQRAELIMAHLRQWDTWQRGSAAPFGTTFAGAIDTGRVALFGHSRGAEAVAHVPGLLATTPIPGVTVTSVFSLAPTDYRSPVPTGVAYGVVLPGCDGDVSTLVGTDIYDRSIRAMDDFPRAQVLFPGANHNFFNTEWRTDDSEGDECAASWEVGGAAQRGMLEGVFGAWLDGTVASASPEPFLRADVETPEGIDAWAAMSLDLRWSYATRRLRIDEFEGAATPAQNLLGEANSYSGFETALQCFDNECSGRYPHEKGAMRFRWDGMTPVATFDLGGVDASGYGYFSFRVVSRESTFNSGREQVFTVRVVDSAGVSAEVLTDRVTRIPHLYPHHDPLEILQTVRVPWDAFRDASPGFDVSRIDRAELEFAAPMHSRGSVLISDISVGD